MNNPYQRYFLSYTKFHRTLEYFWHTMNKLFARNVSCTKGSLTNNAPKKEWMSFFITMTRFLTSWRCRWNRFYFTCNCHALQMIFWCENPNKSISCTLSALWNRKFLKFPWIQQTGVLLVGKSEEQAPQAMYAIRFVSLDMRIVWLPAPSMLPGSTLQQTDQLQPPHVHPSALSKRPNEIN